jgi:hypothetical protein
VCIEPHQYFRWQDFEDATERPSPCGRADRRYVPDWLFIDSWSALTVPALVQGPHSSRPSDAWSDCSCHFQDLAGRVSRVDGESKRSPLTFTRHGFLATN